MTAAPARSRPARADAGVRVRAQELPVARVLVDVSLAHLDRPYDYLVAESDSVAARTGVRVRVRFAGRLVNGYVLGRVAESEHPGRLGFVERVVSDEPVLTAEVAELAAAVAERYAGSVADVLRLAVPPRHAKTEAERFTDPAAPPPAAGDGALSSSGIAAGRPGAADDESTNGAAGDDGRPGAAADDESPNDAARDVGQPGEADVESMNGAAGNVGRPGAADIRSTNGAAGNVGRPGAADIRSTNAAAPGGGWRRYQAGPAFLTAIREHRPARAVWQALPGEDWPTRLAEAAAEALGAGAGALLIVPDAKDLARLDAALSGTLGPGRHVSLSADLGPAHRYRRFLAVSRGDVRVVAGTRAAVFAPVANLGLVAVFDDGDDLLAEPRAPYPHAREVLMLRSAARSCALLVGGFARTAEAQLLVESGWARAIGAQRTAVRAASPRIEAAGDDFSAGADSAAAKARLSPAAFAAARAALQAGAPVLVQVPRRGYLPVVACVRCRRRAQCRHCHGPLALSGPAGTLLGCRWCGQPEAHYRCAACGSDQLRAVAVGAGRTAEEFGRAFPGIAVINSSGAKVRAGVAALPALVIATPGGEPVADGGYGAALLLDGFAMLGRPDLRAGEETLRRWMAAAALVRPAAAGGRVVIGGDASLPVVQALIRWDPVGHAAAELAGRRELGFPPAAAMASIEGDEPIVLAALEKLDVPPDGEVLGPVAVDNLDQGSAPGPAASAGEPQLRALVRVPQSQRKSLSTALRALAAGRSARKEGGGLRIRVDPADLF